MFDVVEGQRLANNRMFADIAPCFADGIKAGIDGSIWASAGRVGEDDDGVRVFAPDGALVGRIHLPEICSNLCFGGEKRNRPFMAGSRSPYAVYVETQGAPMPGTA